MKRIARSKVLYLTLLFPLSFLPALFMNPITVYLFVGSILFTTSIAVMVAYWPSYLYALTTSEAKVDYVDVLSMGIMIVFGAMACREGYVTIYREFFPPPVWNRSANYYLPLSFFRFMAVWGALLHLSARKAMLGPSMMRRVPGWPSAIFSIGAGVLIAIYLLSRYNFHPTV